MSERHLQVTIVRRSLYSNLMNLIKYYWGILMKNIVICETFKIYKIIRYSFIDLVYCNIHRTLLNSYQLEILSQSSVFWVSQQEKLWSFTNHTYVITHSIKIYILSKFQTEFWLLIFFKHKYFGTLQEKNNTLQFNDHKYTLHH